MSFETIYFLIFFLVVIIINYILPVRFRNSWLLIVSLAFYFSTGFQAFFFLLGVILLTFFLGIFLEKIQLTYKKKGMVAVSVFLLVVLLIAGKYVPAISFFRGAGLFVPLGISFFTLQAIGYIIDVYRKKISAEKNIVHFSLYLSFFPYITSGPIERAYRILPQIKSKRKFCYIKFCHGLQKILWGYFIKLVVAERAGIVANTVFDDFTNFSGIPMILGILFFSIQLYSDFYGYSLIALGTGQALGFDLMTNFRQPYFATSISDFWRRWHISLTSWFREYLYIPLGGNRKGTIVTYVNVLIVFLISGLWHGISFTFLFWGMLHGGYKVLGDLLKKIREKTIKKLRIRKETFSFSLLQRIFTFLFVTTAWIFFRSESIQQGFLMILRSVKGFNVSVFFGNSNLQPYEWISSGTLLSTDSTFFLPGLDLIQGTVLCLGVLMLIIMDLLQYKNISPSTWLDGQMIWLRWGMYLMLIFLLLTFGIYGAGYEASSFIYSGF